MRFFENATMNRYLIPVLAATALCLPACKKDKTTSTTPQPIDSVVYPSDAYLQLKTGNYWVYQEYRQDSPSVAAVPLGIYDSCYVAADTNINGKTYHQLVMNIAFQNGASVYALRDSLSYIVNQVGIISFSATDFTNIFRTIVQPPGPAHGDTAIITERMGFRDSTITVDAGTYDTYSFRRIWDFLPMGNVPEQQKEYDFMYARNIGLVKFGIAFYTSAPVLYEDRLVRYHVQ